MFAVVTNVVPYILALSALTVILQSVGVGSGAYTRTIAITVSASHTACTHLRVRCPVSHRRHARDGLGWLIWWFVASLFS